MFQSNSVAEPLRITKAGPFLLELPVPAQRNSAAPPRIRPAGDPARTAGGGAILLYQPRRSLQDGAPTGAEVRLRATTRRSGSIGHAPLPPPGGDHGPAAEAGFPALHTACADAAKWTGGRVRVGVDAGRLHGDGLAEQVAAALQESGLEPERLVLGFNEPALVGIAVEALLTLSALRDLGVGIELDDFGAECGSLALLKQLPLTALKLSRTLLRGVPEDREAAAIVHAVIAAATACGLDVVADGVETERLRGFLASWGCDEGQGGLFGYPVPAHALA